MINLLQKRKNGTGEGGRPRSPTMLIFGVRVDNIDGSTAMDVIQHYVRNRSELPARQVFFTNVHTIHLARRNSHFLRCIRNADTVLPDGSGLMMAGRMFGTPIRENLNGTDFMPKILHEAEVNQWTVYLLGARPTVLERCKERLGRMFPRLQVVGSCHGHFSDSEDDSIVDDINLRRPDILLVALGSPLQEEWIVRNAPRLEVGTCFAVGGLFDFFSGFRKRAPLWMRKLGVEWVHRFFQHPHSKWQRIFIEIPLFVIMVLAKRFIPTKIQAFISGRRAFS